MRNMYSILLCLVVFAITCFMLLLQSHKDDKATCKNCLGQICTIFLLGVNC